jgi:hypothetical protein
VKKLLFIVASSLLITACNDEGAEFVGTWYADKDSVKETIEVVKIKDGYRATSNTEPEMFGEIEFALTPESETTLIDSNTKQVRLVLTPEGKLESHLRNTAILLDRK